MAARRTPGKRTLTDKLGPVQSKPATTRPSQQTAVRPKKATIEDSSFLSRSPDATGKPGQAARTVQARGAARNPAAEPDNVQRAASAGIAGSSTSLPHMARIQQAFGAHDVSTVKAHVGGSASAACDDMGATAYATGNHVAFRSSPDLHTAAHEAAHVVQQRAGVQLKGGVGQAGDRYEQHADAVADAVVQGRSAEKLLDRHAGSSSASTAVQRKANISTDEEQTVRDRAGAHLSQEAIKERGNEEPMALVARDAPSMAQDPEFEAAAIQWEDIFGGIAYNDDRAKQVVDAGCQKAVAYLTRAAGTWERENKKLQAELAKVHITDTGWSGGVGNDIDAVMRAFTTASLGVKIAHLENFCNKILAQDILSRDERSLDEILEAAGIDKDELADTIERVKGSNSRYAFHDVKGEAKEQWHMRSPRNPTEPQKNVSERTVDDVGSLGVKLDQDEKQFMGLNKGSDTLKWGEGARIWALNERNKWVFAMRQLSLPLAAGVSGTTARMMQSFQMLGVGNAADNRLACIAYLLPTHHHSLVEVLVGAQGNGGPAVAPGPQMYRKIEPFTEDDLRARIGWFPDERVAAKDRNIV